VQARRLSSKYFSRTESARFSGETSDDHEAQMNDDEPWSPTERDDDVRVYTSHSYDEEGDDLEDDFPRATSPEEEMSAVDDDEPPVVAPEFNGSGKRPASSASSAGATT